MGAATGKIDQKASLSLRRKTYIGVLHVIEVIGGNGKGVQIFDEGPLPGERERPLFIEIGEPLDL